MARREEREQAFVLLFEQSLNGDSIEDLAANAEETGLFVAGDFALRLAQGTLAHCAELDADIAKSAKGWKLARLSKVCLALLRLCLYEMRFEQGIPLRVSINEAVELAKKYGGADEPAYLNGVLGGAVKSMDLHDDDAGAKA